MKVTIEQIKKHFENGGEICAPFHYHESDGCKNWYYVNVSHEDLLNSMIRIGAQKLVIDDTILPAINWFIAHED